MGDPSGRSAAPSPGLPARHTPRPRRSHAPILEPPNRLDAPEMAGEALEVDEDVIELCVAIRFNLRKDKQLIIRYELARLIRVCEGESGVADDFLLRREPNLFRGFVRQ